MNDQKQEKTGTRYSSTVSEHLLVGIKIAIPVLPFMGSYTSNYSRSCVNDDCSDLLAFANCRILVRKKSDIGNFESSDAKTAALYKKLIT